MEFIVTSVEKATMTGATSREALHLFEHWEPPEGVNLKFLYFGTDGRRSFALLETDSAARIAEITLTFSDYIEFDVYPVVPAQEGAAIMGKQQAWVDQIKSH